MIVSGLQRTQRDNVMLPELLTVELSITELCNRTCSFCPRHDPKIYPNKNYNMTVETATVIAEELHRCDFKGYIVLAGYGEPMLNPNVLEIVKVLSKYHEVEIITNGDSILKNKFTVYQLLNAGLTRIIISDYDNNPIWKEYKYTQLSVRNHYDDKSGNIELYNFNNRGGSLQQPENVVKNPCFIPTYKTIIDWQGDVILCSHNWLNKVSFGNVNESTFESIWNSDKLKQMRIELIKGNRHLFSSCKNCNVKGNRFGGKSADKWQRK